MCLLEYFTFDAILKNKDDLWPFFWHLCQGYFCKNIFCYQDTNCDVGVFDRVTGACNPVPGQSAGTYGGKLYNIPNPYIRVLDFFFLFVWPCNFVNLVLISVGFFFCLFVFVSLGFFFKVCFVLLGGWGGERRGLGFFYGTYKM